MKSQKSLSERKKYLEKIGFKSEVEKLRKDYSNSKRFNQFKHSQRSKSLKMLPAKTDLTKQAGQFLKPTKIISVSSPKWAIFDYYSGKYIRGYRAHDPHELSVFSKLLVFCTINTLVTKHHLDMSRFQTIVTGTVLKYHKKSNLKEDDIINLDHLLHLMLMTEGEEYELVAAVNIGAYLDKKRKKEYYSVYDADDKLFKIHIKEFYDFVNSYCQTMKLQNIKYIEFDPQKRREKNRCSAVDVASLSLQCLKIPLFQQIMKKKTENIIIKFINDGGILDSKTITLTNKTIQNPFISYFNVSRNWQENQFMNSHCSVFYDTDAIKPIVAVTLACYSPNDREKDIQQLIQWYIKSVSEKEKKIAEREEEKLKEKEDPQDIYQAQKNHKFKTELTDQLDTILEEKLKSNPSKYDFRIKGVTKKSRNSKRLITDIA